MPFNKVADYIDKNKHGSYRGNDCQHHDNNLFYHTNGRDHGIQRKHNIDEHNLENCPMKGGSGTLGISVFVLPLQLVMNFVGGFTNEKKPSCEQDQVAAGKSVPEYLK